MLSIVDNIIPWLESMDPKPMTTYMNSDMMRHIPMLGSCQTFHSHGHDTFKQNNSSLTCLNPHIKIIQIHSTITSHHIEVNSSSS